MKFPFKDFLSKIFKKAAGAAPFAPAEKRKINDIALFEDDADGKIEFKNLVLNGVDGEVMIDYGTFTLSPGDRMMLSGPAGCGKSAGLAAMRNAWLLGGSGEIRVPSGVRFVPQEEYFPNRTLRGIVCAPDGADKYTKEQVEQALADAGLAEFIPQMDDAEKRGEYWKNTLSGGQKNKLSFAGVFLHADATKVLVVDEITAALDAKSEAELYPKLLDRHKHGIVISVAHHSTLSHYHNIFAKVEAGKVRYARVPPPAKPPPPKP